MMMATEEMAELTKEISKNLRREDNVREIAEEIADVRIMLEQIERMFNIEASVQEWKELKINRLSKLVGRAN